MSNRVNSILGKNGSGKSQILRLISGLDVPSSGEMYLDKINLLSSAEYHQGQVAYASIDSIPYPEMTVEQYYRYLAIFKADLTEDLEGIIGSIFKKLGIRHLHD